MNCLTLLSWLIKGVATGGGGAECTMGDGVY